MWGLPAVPESICFRSLINHRSEMECVHVVCNFFASVPLTSLQDLDLVAVVLLLSIISNS